MTTDVRRETEIAQGAHFRYTDGGWQEVADSLPEEASLPIFVNGQELVSILCTPEKLNCLVVGYLASQGLISSMADILTMRICTEELVADVRLKKEIDLPTRRTLTSGCGGGVVFEGEGLSPVACSKSFSPQEILSLTHMLLQLERVEPVETRRRGMHASVLGDDKSLPIIAHDIGRHNTLDKIWGECILRKLPTIDSILVSTGRISSEMVQKAARMGVPVVASLNSATQRAVELGTRLGVTTIGYTRGSQFTVFCGRERIVA